MGLRCDWFGHKSTFTNEEGKYMARYQVRGCSRCDSNFKLMEDYETRVPLDPKADKEVVLKLYAILYSRNDFDNSIADRRDLIMFLRAMRDQYGDWLHEAYLRNYRYPHRSVAAVRSNIIEKEKGSTIYGTSGSPAYEFLKSFYGSD